MANEAPEQIANKPSEQEYQIVGAINIAWATLDSNVSAAMFSVLKIDAFEFLILVGRVEPEAKLAKLAQILKHRKDTRSKIAAEWKKKIDKKKPLRNAMTHGQYQGKTLKDELLWSIPSEIVQGPDGPATKLVVATNEDLVDHLTTILETLSYLRSSFDYEEMQPLLRLPSHVSGRSLAVRYQGSSPSPHQRPSQQHAQTNQDQSPRPRKDGE